MELESRWNIGNDIQMPARYAQQLSIVEDILWGERHNANKEYTDFLNEYCEQAFNDLQKVVKNKSLEEMELIHDKRKRNITKTVENLDVEIAAIEAEAERYSEWLRKQSPSKENGGSNRTIRRTEMERARYFLSRIESVKTPESLIIWQVRLELITEIAILTGSEATCIHVFVTQAFIFPLL